ncbi:hypothetical protein [Eisenibacter elegans]|jgi:hypothetical protein|uniref:hypothetical protein n=1 Tax=Eisenibacter elegans TaxID=997 RepID=UPI000555D1DF|nr:hypothetical protein [Eisenibacter elegans]
MKKTYARNLALLVLTFFLLGGTQSCIFFADQNHSKMDKMKNPNKNNSYVYGEVDGPARQLKNTYDDTPEGQKRADAIRQKLYGDKKAEALSDGNVAADTAKADKTAEAKEQPKDEKKADNN